MDKESWCPWRSLPPPPFFCLPPPTFSSHKVFPPVPVFVDNTEKWKKLYQSPLIQWGGKRPATLLKKRLWHRCFPLNFVKLLTTTFLQNP